MRQVSFVRVSVRAGGGRFRGTEFGRVTKDCEDTTAKLKLNVEGKVILRTTAPSRPLRQCGALRLRAIRCTPV